MGSHGAEAKWRRGADAERLQRSARSQRRLSADVEVAIVDSGKSPAEQLSSRNEFGSAVFRVRWARGGRDPVGRQSRDGEKKD